MKTSCLVLYASTHGHTAKIAERIAERLRHHDLVARLHDVVDDAPDPEDYALVVLGGSIHSGDHQAELATWTDRHRIELDALPTAFFSVSLTAADSTPEAQEKANGYVEDLLATTGLRPDVRATFAGALQYREYDIATRVLLKLIARHKGLETDTHVDADYTDWDAVDRFADHAAELVGVAVTAG